MLAAAEAAAVEEEEEEEEPLSTAGDSRLRNCDACFVEEAAGVTPRDTRGGVGAGVGRANVTDFVSAPVPGVRPRLRKLDGV